MTAPFAMMAAPGIPAMPPLMFIFPLPESSAAGSSVLGSVLAIVIALQFGLNVTLASGAAAYLVALALLPALGTGRAMSHA